LIRRHFITPADAAATLDDAFRFISLRRPLRRLLTLSPLSRRRHFRCFLSPLILFIYIFDIAFEYATPGWLSITPTPLRHCQISFHAAATPLLRHIDYFRH
jgi:hypothetical protein